MIQIIIISLNYLNKTVGFTTNLFIFLFLTYTLITLYLTYKILNYKKNKINYIKYVSLVQDLEFIIFKTNLLKFYYSTITILFIFLFILFINNKKK